MTSLRCAKPIRRASRAHRILSAPCRRYSRPTFAPHPQPDIKHIAQNPGLYEQNCLSRNYQKLSKYPWAILQLRNENIALARESAAKRRELQALQSALRQSQNAARRDEDNGDETGSSSDFKALREKARGLKEELDAYNNRTSKNEDEILNKALVLPNLSSQSTPDGTEPKTLDVVRNIEPNRLASLSDSHVQIGADLSILNFTSSATTSGWGWYYLDDIAADLEDALVQYAISVLRQKGWKRVSPPTMVYSHISNACGFQPRDQNDEQQIYQVEMPAKRLAKDTSPHVLTGTAEISLAGEYANQTLRADELPLKKYAVSRCYRAEAGARGADTKGLYRVHEFTKVEMFAWAKPEEDEGATGPFDVSSEQSQSQTDRLFDEMIGVQKKLLDGLGLDYRILEMPSTDLGASATRKIDIEAFFPSRRSRDEGWGEVTSASICTDYQTRRLGTRFQREGSAKLGYPYTLNGTAMAIPRILAALLECNWDKKKKELRLPAVLLPWMDGVKVVRTKK